MHTPKFTSSFTAATALWYVAWALLVAVIPAWAGDAAQNGRISFVGNQSGSWQLYTMNPDGTNMVQITNLAATVFETWAPDFSPDGRRITFCYGTLDSSGNLVTEIYLINVDGAGLTQLTHDGLIDCFPRWSPDGSRIVFGRESPTSLQLVLTTMRADGSDQRALSTPFWGIARAGYTPDGKHILWETQQAGFVSVLWVANANGAEQERLTPAALKAGETSAPAPDGEHVVFINNQNSPAVLTNTLFVMKLDGTGLKQLTHPIGTSHDVYPNYSPDGAKIVFASDRMSSDGSLDIFTVKADGSNLTRIATGVTGGAAPTKIVSPRLGGGNHEGASTVDCAQKTNRGLFAMCSEEAS